MLKPIEPSPTLCSDSKPAWLQVSPDNVPARWGEIGPLVRRILMREAVTYNERDVLLQLLNGAWLLFAAGEPMRAMCILEIANFPRIRKMVIHYVAGESALMLDALPQLETLARAWKCSKIAAPYARNGWMRKLPGWKPGHMILEKDIEQ
jgi:hypothetical protein